MFFLVFSSYVLYFLSDVEELGVKARGIGAGIVGFEKVKGSTDRGVGLLEMSIYEDVRAPKPKERGCWRGRDVDVWGRRGSGTSTGWGD